MKWIVLAVVVTVGIVALVAWWRMPNPVITPLADKLQYPGFQTFPTPRTFDAPGTIFRIDESGTRFPVALLPVKLEMGKEAFATYISTTRWKLSALVKFIGDIGVEAMAEVSSPLTLKVALGRGEREWTFDADVDQALKNAIINYRMESKYYVIRETISVPSITYDFSGSGEFNTTAKQAIDEVAKGKQHLSWSNSSQNTLIESFDRPYRIFYTADEILIPELGAAQVEPQRIPVKYTIVWSAEER